MLSHDLLESLVDALQKKSENLLSVSPDLEGNPFTQEVSLHSLRIVSPSAMIAVRRYWFCLSRYVYVYVYVYGNRSFAPILEHGSGSELFFFSFEQYIIKEPIWNEVNQQRINS
jgi:hypothetical protein